MNRESQEDKCDELQEKKTKKYWETNQIKFAPMYGSKECRKTKSCGTLLGQLEKGLLLCKLGLGLQKFYSDRDSYELKEKLENCRRNLSMEKALRKSESSLKASRDELEVKRQTLESLSSEANEQLEELNKCKDGKKKCSEESKKCKAELEECKSESKKHKAEIKECSEESHLSASQFEQSSKKSERLLKECKSESKKYSEESKKYSEESLLIASRFEQSERLLEKCQESYSVSAMGDEEQKTQIDFLQESNLILRNDFLVTKKENQTLRNDLQATKKEKNDLQATNKEKNADLKKINLKLRTCDSDLALVTDLDGRNQNLYR
jgi:chromosome segregation ATPase